MLRRSNSGSNIPLRKANLFGSKVTKPAAGAGRKRSQSVTRLSHRDSESAPFQRQSRNSSLDRKSNYLGLPRTTPVTKPGNRGSASSLQRTTPSSAISQRKTSSRGTTPTPCLIERKVTIQKLATDKRWVAEQYAKVQNFIVSNPDIFECSVVNMNNIKPPSINIFIYITEMLLLHIFPKIKIRTENYKEVIPAHLKIIRYPGTLTVSILKTVNTMHSWPQVIGMWSWLIDKVNLTRCSDDLSFVDHLEPEERQKYLLNQICGDFLIQRYSIFNSDTNNAEEIQKANDQYVKNLEEILEVDFEKFQQLQADIAEKKKYRDKQIQESEQLKADKLRIQLEIDEMTKEMEEFQEMDAVEETELDNQLQLMQINLTELQDTRISIKQNINQLEAAIKVQPCTYQTKLALLRQIDELRDDIKVKKGKIEHAQKIKNKFDHQLTSEISKIQAIVIQWNRSLMELCIQKPELRKLMLREKGFHVPQFLSEIKEVLQHKVTLENRVKNELIKVVDDLRAQEQRKQEIEREIKELIQVTEHTSKECIEIEERIIKVKQEIKEIVGDLEQKRKSHFESVKELQEKANSDDKTKIIAEMKQKKENLDVEVKKFGKKMLSFFVEMHNQVTSNIKEMNAIRKSVVKNFEDRVSSTLEKQKQLIEALQSFNDLSSNDKV